MFKFFVVFIIFQISCAAPVDEKRNILNKRDLAGHLALTDFISEVENSLIKDAFKAGSNQEFHSLRDQRQVTPEKFNKSPNTQISIVTVKLNTQKKNSTDDLIEEKQNSDDADKKDSTITEQKDAKAKNDKVLESISKIESDISSSKANEDSKNSSKTSGVKSEGGDKNQKKIAKKEKEVEIKVAEVEVNPVILSSRV